MKSKKILSVIIPVYNEESTVEEILDKVLSRPETGEIIIVDDASSDKSVEVIKKYIDSKKKKNIKLFSQKQNRGKGAAIRRGFDEASCPIVIIQDADWEYTPDDYPVVLEPIISGKADVCYGSRFQPGPGQVHNFRHMMGNKFLTNVSNFLTNLALTDMETCYKAFKREVIQNLNLETNRFGIEVEMTAKIAKAKCLDIYEVPIRYFSRSYEEGKKIGWKDGVAAFWYMVKYNLLKSRQNFYKKPWKDVMR
jgi:glycosyltransferase involved in cell wall biosynthesis